MHPGNVTVTAFAAGTAKRGEDAGDEGQLEAGEQELFGAM
jgi:hypothetical protein